jgi:hypothetical protein
MALTFTFDGKTIKFNEVPYSGDVVKENSKYMIQRYESGKAVGEKTELIKVKSIDEATQAFYTLVAAKQRK